MKTKTSIYFIITYAILVPQLAAAGPDAGKLRTTDPVLVTSTDATWPMGGFSGEWSAAFVPACTSPAVVSVVEMTNGESTNRADFGSLLAGTDSAAAPVVFPVPSQPGDFLPVSTLSADGKSCVSSGAARRSRAASTLLSRI